MKLHRWEDIRKKHLTPKETAANRAWAERELLEMDLRAVRELVGKTQVDVAKATKMAQSDVSKAEHRDDHRLSTLRRYIEALGGELEVIARFGDKMVRLRGV
jgi:hypothetical protein